MNICEICFDLTDEINELCKHHFHQKCIKFGRIIKCPICNIELYKNDIWRHHYSFPKINNDWYSYFVCDICNSALESESSWTHHDCIDICNECYQEKFWNNFKKTQYIEQCETCPSTASFEISFGEYNLFLCSECHINKVHIGKEIDVKNTWYSSNRELVDITIPDKYIIPKEIENGNHEITSDRNAEYINILCSFNNTNISGSLLNWTLITDLINVAGTEIGVIIDLVNKNHPVGIIFSDFTISITQLFDTLEEYLELSKNKCDVEIILIIIDKFNLFDKIYYSCDACNSNTVIEMSTENSLWKIDHEICCSDCAKKFDNKYELKYTMITDHGNICIKPSNNIFPDGLLICEEILFSFRQDIPKLDFAIISGSVFDWIPISDYLVDDDDNIYLILLNCADNDHKLGIYCYGEEIYIKEVSVNYQDFIDNEMNIYSLIEH